MTIFVVRNRRFPPPNHTRINNQTGPSGPQGRTDQLLGGLWCGLGVESGDPENRVLRKTSHKVTVVPKGPPSNTKLTASLSANETEKHSVVFNSQRPARKEETAEIVVNAMMSSAKTYVRN